MMKVALALLLALAPPLASSPAHAQGAAVRERLASDADFDQLARVEGAGRFMELPRVMFAIDRGAKPARVHWIDTRRFPFHFDYLQARYLTLADADAFVAANYSRADRRFVLGAVVRYPRSGKYGVEMWEGDAVAPELLAAMMEQLGAAFHAALTFKPNSDAQRLAAEAAKLPVIGVDEAYGGRTQLVLNRGRATGRLMLVEEDRADELLPGDMIVQSRDYVRGS